MADPFFSIKTDSERNDYGKYSFEPLTQGYGQTLGNSLRRVLLTSLEGTAIVSVKIEGVKHQFTTLPGLKEDIIELLLNVKKIRLSINSDEEAILHLSKKGPGEFTAGDIDVPAGVTVVNPDLVLGTLSDKKAEIEMTLTAKRGYGYVTADEQLREEVGVIPLDALFSPITRVNYHVEATRVGRMTNLDSLIMEVWTDGTINSLDAIKSAAKVLVGYFTQVYEPKEKKKEEESSASQGGMSDDELKIRIEEFDIPTRIVNALANGGIETIGQLLQTPREELMKIKNLGAKSLSIVEEKLKDKRITLS